MLVGLGILSALWEKAWAKLVALYKAALA